MHRDRLAGVICKIVMGSAIAGCHGAVAAPAPSRLTVRPGIDVVLTDSSSLLHGRRVGFLTNTAAVDANGVGDIARLRSAGVHLVALFAPEHGITGAAAPGEQVASGVDSAAQIPVYSLYGKTTTPTVAMLAGIDVLVVDLPDVGARYYTYLATTVNVMHVAAEHHIPVVILDRPNPIGGAVQGNILDTQFVSMVGRLAVPMRHGLTLGEEARLAASDLKISVELHVVPAAGWRRDMDQDATHLPFRAPSPNLQSIEALFAYTGSCLFEGTALSVGRGTDAAFLQVGAPWLDTSAVLARLRARPIAGVRFEATSFTPHLPGDKKFADTLVAGIRWVVTDRRAFDGPATAVELLSILQSMYPDRLKIGGSFDRLAGGRTLRESIVHGDRPEAIVASWAAGQRAFRERSKGWLLYTPGVR